ncbi:hypothetical protein [Streptomyces sp. NPDC007088]|uniref:hypothetical protein n=1 Tax=Streptomyces sp. NPDC007088 TaxID=3364773 RepID=UPI0036CF9625
MSKMDKPLKPGKAAKRLGVYPSALPAGPWSSARVRQTRKERPDWLTPARRAYSLAKQQEAQLREEKAREKEIARVHAARTQPPTTPRSPRAARAITWITVPMLRTRGWTDAAIRDFLPAAEKTRSNPHFSTAGEPMRLWSPATIAAAEASEQWQAWLETSLTRRRTTLAALSYPPGASDAFLAKLQSAQEAIATAN